MHLKRSTMVGAVLAVAVAATPVSPAIAGGGYHGGHGYGYYYGGPIVGLANALIGVAAAVITAPIVILAAAARAPYYAQGLGYPAPAGYAGPDNANYGSF